MYGVIHPAELVHLHNHRAPPAQGVLPGILPPAVAAAPPVPTPALILAAQHGGRNVRFRTGFEPVRMSALCYRCTRTAVLYLRGSGADVPPGYEWVGDGLGSTLRVDF